jgi:hypothetical protein
MALHIIHEDEHPVTLGPVWRVVQDPLDTDDPDFVVFTMHSGRGLEVRGIAYWFNNRWARNLWVPAPPQVPLKLLQIVEDHLKQEPQS